MANKYPPPPPQGRGAGDGLRAAPAPAGPFSLSEHRGESASSLLFYPVRQTPWSAPKVLLPSRESRRHFRVAERDRGWGISSRTGHRPRMFVATNGLNVPLFGGTFDKSRRPSPTDAYSSAAGYQSAPVGS